MLRNRYRVLHESGAHIQTHLAERKTQDSARPTWLLSNPLNGFPQRFAGNNDLCEVVPHQLL